jgi:hypothetical protein
MCVFEKDADFSRSCFVEGGKKHRPDMVIDNAFDDNVKIVFDLVVYSAKLCKTIVMNNQAVSACRRNSRDPTPSTSIDSTGRRFETSMATP